jgi:hypothetical protein
MSDLPCWHRLRTEDDDIPEHFRSPKTTSDLTLDKPVPFGDQDRGQGFANADKTPAVARMTLRNLTELL